MTSASQLERNYRLGIFTTQAEYFEQTALAHQRIADSEGYRRIHAYPVVTHDR